MFDPPVREFLERAVIPVRLACLTRSGWPLVVSLWYLLRDDHLYCATQAGSQLVRHLTQNDRCGYEVAADLPPYCGVRGKARVEIDASLGAEILEQLLLRYVGSTESPFAAKLLAHSASEVALRLEPLSAYVWNFSERMKDSVNANPKPCP